MTSDPSPRKQWIVIGAVFAAIVVLLAGGYYLLLSEGYALLADRVRPGEAAAIVAELDKRGTAYRLRDDGTTILVPEGDADATRLALVRSDAATSGQIGFELFNKTDMGLTNFAQKINYQRALQGELVRTVIAMDGIERARVHLALPDRALFRDERISPSAAVTVAMRPGQVPDPSRVVGIQQLIAAAVPDLPADRVVVLDATGRVLSRTVDVLSSDRIGQPPDLEARVAVENYYRALARTAIESARPALRYKLRVAAEPSEGSARDIVRWTPGTSGEARNFRLRLTLVTPEPVDAEARAAVDGAVTAAAGLDEARGDLIQFETGRAESFVLPPTWLSRSPAYEDDAVPAKAIARQDGGSRLWLWGAALGLLALLAVARWRAARAPTLLSDADREAFAQTLRRQLAATDEVSHAAR